MKIPKRFSPGINADFRARYWPILRRLCRTLPAEMYQVLSRPFGNLGQWIDIDERCGCLVGTIALVCKFDGHIDTVSPREMAQFGGTSMSDLMRESAPSLDEEFRTDLIMMGIHAPDTEQYIQRWLDEFNPRDEIPDGIALGTYIESLYKIAHDLFEQKVKAFIRKELAKPAAAKAIRAWKRQQKVAPLRPA